MSDTIKRMEKEFDNFMRHYREMDADEFIKELEEAGVSFAGERETTMIDNTPIKYIHYGHNFFVINIFNAIRNRKLCNKPFGGLWASRVNADYGWKDFCIDENFCVESLNKSFEFSISSNANVIEIHSAHDFWKLTKIKNQPWGGMHGLLPDFEAMLTEKIDAIEVLISEDPQVYYGLYGWDVDSILIMNPEIIILN